MNSPHLLFNNTVAWIVQGSILALIATGLPLLFRIRHPKTQLAFYQSVLVICLTLPIVEPWYHPLLIATRGAISTSAANPASVSWQLAGLWLVAAGIVAKLGWLASGYCQTRRFRSAASPIKPVLESIRVARERTHADARFGISSSVDGPATLGHVDPIILLPESFLSLPYDAQLSIACHELLHVKRNDWIVTMLEEIVTAVFWFNPAIWLLRSQIRLSREQLVDAEVVRFTDEPAPYVQALLAMAGTAKGMKLLPAAPFLSGGHLMSRIRLLLDRNRRSTARLCFSYVSVVALLFVLGWIASIFFPLTGKAQSIEAFAIEHRTPPSLMSWNKAAEVPNVHLQEFTVRVPAPVVPSNNPQTDVMYFRNPQEAGTFPEASIGPSRIFMTRGVRVLHPGDVPTPEEIARLQSGSDGRTFIDVVRSPEGVIQRITVQLRSFSNESDFRPSDTDFAADAPIRIH